MTLEKLLESSADELERLTDTEIESLFAPLFNVVRPTGKPVQPKTPALPKPPKKVKGGLTEEQLDRLRRMEEKSGIKLL